MGSTLFPHNLVRYDRIQSETGVWRWLPELKFPAVLEGEEAARSHWNKLQNALIFPANQYYTNAIHEGCANIMTGILPPIYVLSLKIRNCAYSFQKSSY
jgi:hypothetical protein